MGVKAVDGEGYRWYFPGTTSIGATYGGKTERDEWDEWITGKESMKDKVYLIGPMSGIDDYNFYEFYMTQSVLELWGYEVINPARIDIECGDVRFDHRTGAVVKSSEFRFPVVMRKDFLSILNECKAVVLMDGWENSYHGKQELLVAVSTGVKVFRYNGPEVPIDIEFDTPLEVEVNANCQVVRKE